MLPPPLTNRLSPKNQVTLPRDAGALTGGVTALRALPDKMPSPADPAQASRVVVMMTEAALRHRERSIIASPDVDHAVKAMLVQRLNAWAVPLAIDDQRRVVVPAHLVEYLALDRDVLFVTTAELIYMWNPDEFRRWNDVPLPTGSPDLSRFILV